MRVLLAVLYTLALIGATPAAADRAAAEAARAGDMRKLVIHPAPQPFPAVDLVTLDDSPRSLDEWRGQWVVVNFWATWCAPCRHEMPSLDALAATGQPVVTIATGRNPVPSIERFWAETGITHLPALRDPRSDLARQIGILGLPVTVILNPEGQEVARLTGDADWSAPEARAVLAALAQ
ncbi:MAG TPA: TlpA disulfide reductase family protein [Paracoccaceae bacterium]|nr:TlpA disulfide reductase family protein [Paracoccaceae bacterium]HMO72703.1 TlpA disulfide reductase family protein [Paracoccaceae bacterium]